MALSFKNLYSLDLLSGLEFAKTSKFSTGISHFFCKNSSIKFSTWDTVNPNLSVQVGRPSMTVRVLVENNPQP